MEDDWADHIPSDLINITHNNGIDVHEAEDAGDTNDDDFDDDSDEDEVTSTEDEISSDDSDKETE